MYFQLLTVYYMKFAFIKHCLILSMKTVLHDSKTM